MSEVAYVAVSNAERRARIVEDLRRQGWTVIEQPTGAHLLAALAEVIDGTASPPAKVVIDAHARGCSGKSIAAGFAALGLSVPVELVEERPERQAMPSRSRMAFTNVSGCGGHPGT
jgi:hypothetical protein